MGSKPKSSQAALTSSFTGILASSITMPTFDCRANSLSVVAKPPLVGSRRQCPYSRGGDKQLVGLSSIYHLGIPGDDTDLSFFSSFLYRLHYPSELT